MGMLALAGAVSGGGKTLQRGLENTQQYMSQSLLLEERDKNERERMKLTFGHDEGMLQKRLEGERANNVESAKLQHGFAMERDAQNNSQALDRLDMQQDETARQARIEREFRRTQDTASAQAALEKEMRERGYKEKDAKDQAAQKLAEWKREQVSKDREFQQNAGLRLTEKSMDLQKPRTDGSASGKLDPNVNATLKVYDQELKDLGDELNNVMTKPDRAAAIQKRMEVIRNEQFKLLGRSRGEDKPARKPIIFPE